MYSLCFFIMLFLFFFSKQEAEEGIGVGEGGRRERIRNRRKRVGGGEGSSWKEVARRAGVPHPGCSLYTSYAAADLPGFDLGGGRIVIKKIKIKQRHHSSETIDMSHTTQYHRILTILDHYSTCRPTTSICTYL